MTGDIENNRQELEELVTSELVMFYICMTVIDINDRYCIDNEHVNTLKSYI